MTATIGELCAGYGGLGMGVSRVIDSRVAWVSEIDKGALKVLEHRFPGVPNIGDMTTVDWASVPAVDILTGGTPCQDLSHAGKRAGMTEGTRSNLWVAMREAIAVLRPSLVVWENVGGAYSAAADSDLERREGRLGDGPGRPSLRALGRVLGDLASLGYVGGWHGLRAADVGAPHGRLRVFVVAHADDAGRIEQWRPFTARTEHSPAERESTPTLSLLPTPAVNDMGAAYTPETWDEWTDEMKAKHGNGNGHGKSLNVEAQRLLPTPTTQDAANNGGPSQQERNTDPLNAVRDWGDYADAIHHWETLTRPAPEPTMLSRKGTPQLSPAFSEWMMGLPAGWVTDVPGITRNEALRALGNGVVPQQAAAAVSFLLDVLSERVAA